LAASKPRLCLGTVSAARTDWESIIAALGCGLRGQADLGAPPLCSQAVAPLAFQRQ
jgi:hypothetical protein